MIHLDLSLLPLLHSEAVTWDEFLILGLGFALLILVGYSGRYAKKKHAPVGQLIYPANGKTLTYYHGLSIQDVSYRYGTDWALSRVSLEIPAGQYFAILGPNGAGKTTLLNILSTLIEPISGDVKVGDISLSANPIAIRRRVGLVSHKPLLYPYLSVLENLKLFGLLYGVPNETERAEMLIQQVQLWPKQHQPVKSLSHGQRQRVAIARALMHNPDILLLDEPYTGLDLRATEQLDTLIDNLLNQGRTLLLTTHDLQRSLSRANQIVIFASGRLIYQAKSQDLTLERLQTIYRRTFKLSEE